VNARHGCSLQSLAATSSSQTPNGRTGLPFYLR